MGKSLVSDAEDLRRGVDFIGVTTPFVVHDGKGKVLLHKRSQNCRDEQGTWDIGGGAVEFGESLEDAVRREIKEELSADVLKLEFLTVFDAHRQHNGQPTHWVAVVFAAKVDPANVKNGDPDRIDELAWFDSTNLPKPLHTQFYKAFNPAKEKGFVH